MIKNRKSTIGYGFIDITYPTLDKTTESCVMGDGSVRVTTTYDPESNLTGIIVSPAPKKESVGELYVVDGVPVDPEENPNLANETAKYQLLFDNPNSIDVVILRLEEAKKRLLNEDYKDEY